MLWLSRKDIEHISRRLLRDYLKKVPQKIDHADPLPGLLGYGRGYKPGEWIGDFIEVADELPKDITLLENISLDW